MTVNTAALRAAITTATPAKRTTTVKLAKTYTAAFNELAQVKLALSELKNREKELTDAIKAVAGMNADANETIVLEVGGCPRAKISLRERTGIDGKQLQEAFPEAYVACKTVTVYQQISSL